MTSSLSDLGVGVLVSAFRLITMTACLPIPESRVPDPRSYQSYPKYHELGGPLKALEAV